MDGRDTIDQVNNVVTKAAITDIAQWHTSKHTITSVADRCTVTLPAYN